jgi:putative ABC transport system permease protein
MKLLVIAFIALVGLGALAIFLAAGMLSPLAAKPVASIVGKPLARLFKVAGKLGRENSMRSPRRTAQTASALMVGLALVSTMAVFGASLSKSATRSINAAIAMSANPIIINSGFDSLRRWFAADTSISF